MRGSRDSFFASPALPHGRRKATAVLASALDDNAVPTEHESPYEVFVGNVEVHSLDADGCFLPYFEAVSPYRTIATHNIQFNIQQLHKHTDPQRKPGKTVFMVGSARQNMFRDFLSIQRKNDKGGDVVTNSIFHAITEFVDHLKSAIKAEIQKENIQVDFDPNAITLDTMLLDDIWFNRKSGETFLTALNTYAIRWASELSEAFTTIAITENITTVGKYADPDRLKNLLPTINAIASSMQTEMPAVNNSVYFSEEPGKFALLYAQIHHIATQYDPNKHIDFHFYDNRLDILQPLIAVFSHHKDLIPKNMTLHFHHYENGMQKTHIPSVTDIIHRIDGTGMIDEHYRTTIKDLLKTMPVIPVRFPEGFMHIGNPLDTLFDVKIPPVDQTKENYLDISKVATVAPKPAYKKFMVARDSRLCEYPEVTPAIKIRQNPLALPQGSNSSGSLTSLLSSSLSSSVESAASALSAASSVVGSFFGSFGWSRGGSSTAQEANTGHNRSFR